MKSLDQKVILVTGASKGIGAAVARKLAGEGANLIVNYAGDKAGAENLVDELQQRGTKAIEPTVLEFHKSLQGWIEIDPCNIGRAHSSG